MLRPSVAAVVALAVLAPAATAQDSAAGLEDLAVEAAIPQASVISEQYPDVAAVVDEVVDSAPAAPPVAPAAPKPAPPAPVPQESPEQYHSELPNVSVTQQQPSNVNVSIRVNSPGDDGPVVQINGNDNVVGVVQAPDRPAPGDADRPSARPPSAPQPPTDESPAPGIPDEWDWVWTSACFGGAGPAAAAAAGAGDEPGWNWRWSCGEAEDPVDVVVEGITDGIAGSVEELVSAAAPMPLGFAEALSGDQLAAGAAPPPRRPAVRPRDGVRPGHAVIPPPGTRAQGGAVAPMARPLAAGSVSATVPVAAASRAAGAASRAVQAQARSGGGSDLLIFPPGAGGPAAGAASGLGTASALALGAWIAVLMSAVAFVLPRLRPRRWSGPSRRPPQPPRSRLERPG